ncbi:hypothetical protein [Amycolatopsis sp. MtRt-6]|uniref:hypothetical protein n=1 Tax=Amycolatopsis sp. MtRt-6 TaxID=2792782 RepID=UPI001A8DCB48|nr:hypothetical protein [Amycolatopsis sp. MtRt-6]
MTTVPDPNRLFRNRLIRELVAMDLDPDQFVVFGSAPLLAHGLRTTIRDLDVVARGDVLAWAKRAGTPAVGAYSGDPVWQFGRGRIQFSAGWITPHWNAGELIDGAEVIGGLRWARPADVLRYKRELLRPKDLADIAKIRAYLRGPVRKPPQLIGHGPT